MGKGALLVASTNFDGSEVINHAAAEPARLARNETVSVCLRQDATMVGVNILSDEQYRLLAFVSACNGSSYNPTAREVMLWRQNPEPAKAEYRTVEVPGVASGLGTLAGLHEPGSSIQRLMDTIMRDQFRGIHDSVAAITGRYLTQPTTRKELVKEAETVIDHLIRLTWLETVSVPGKSGLRLTELGHALLCDQEKDTVTQPDVSVVVLESNDPLAYPLLVGQLAEAGEGLLVDPYLKLDSLHRIVTSTRLTRLLVTSKRNDAEIAAMRTYLDSASLARHVEVRSSTELHDRYLLSDDGAVLTLGTSLNGVGRTTTVLMPMPSEARETMRETYERIWENGSLVGPQPDETEEDDESNTESDDADDDEPATDGPNEDEESETEMASNDSDEDQTEPTQDTQGQTGDSNKA